MEGAVIRLPSNEEGLRDIKHSVSKAQRNQFWGVSSSCGFIFGSLWHLTTKCGRCYYKMRRLLYYKMRQILQNAIVLLQNRTAFAKLDVTYKMRSCSIRRVLTGIFFITTKPYWTTTEHTLLMVWAKVCIYLNDVIWKLEGREVWRFMIGITTNQSKT